MKSLDGLAESVNETSPSTRREWIEIIVQLKICRTQRSPSTRREWIEILKIILKPESCVSLPPHGGSGLKSFGYHIVEARLAVSLHTEGVD